tara:strand:+ start:11248 stop:11799 length:552 start_codon:yes stop_codon:yes gene_type:complete
MPKLRNTFARSIARAKKLLAKWNTAITKTTLAVLNNKEVELRSYNNPHPKDISELARIIKADQAMHFRAPLQFSKRISEECDGLYFQGRVYISERLTSPKDVATTLIHEVNHYLNQSDEHLETKKQVFKEEYRAAVAEYLGQNRPMTRNLYKICAQRVCEDYDVPLPEEHKPNPKPPKGIFYR